MTRLRAACWDAGASAELLGALPAAWLHCRCLSLVLLCLCLGALNLFTNLKGNKSCSFKNAIHKFCSTYSL